MCSSDKTDHYQSVRFPCTAVTLLDELLLLTEFNKTFRGVLWRALHLQDGGLPRCSAELMFVRCSKTCEAEAGDVRLSRVSIIVFPLKCVSSVRSRLALFTGDFWVCRGKKASSTSQSHHVVDGFPSCVTHPWEQIGITLFFVITQEGKNHQLFKKIGQPVSFEQLPRVHGLVWWRRAHERLSNSNLLVVTKWVRL